jgi:hypothetical protein
MASVCAFRPTLTTTRIAGRCRRSGRCLAASWLCWRGWAGSGHRPDSFTGDLLHFHYPLRDFYARALADGQRIDWLPGLFSGFYVVGEGQLGGYHPLHWLLYRALPLDRAFAVELVVAYPCLFAGTWLWLRRRVGAGPAAFGAMASTFCGFMLIHGVHPNIVGVLAHAVVAVGARRRGCASHRPPDRRGGGDRPLLGSQLLLGRPQSAWLR